MPPLNLMRQRQRQGFNLLRMPRKERKLLLMQKKSLMHAKKRLMQKQKRHAKVAEEKRIKDQLAADAKKAKAALAVEKAPAIAKGKYLPAGSTTDVRGLTMDTAQNPRLDKNGNVVSAEDAKYLNFTDMIDGGGPRSRGP
jgi:hypothetical protein